jgi:hypothetical protein
MFDIRQQKISFRFDFLLIKSSKTPSNFIKFDQRNN